MAARSKFEAAARGAGYRLRALALVPLLLSGAVAHGAPWRPTNADAVLLQLSAQMQRASAESARARSAEQSTDIASALKLATEYIALGRAESDERYFGYAAAVLQPWTARVPSSIEVEILRADILQHQHRFESARAVLDGVLERDARDTRALLMRATVSIALGKPEEAAGYCRSLMASRGAFLGTICLAQAASLNGRLNASYGLLTTLLGRTDTSSLEPSVAAWGYAITGDMAERFGDHAAAERWLRRSIAAENDLVTRLALADLLLDTHRPAEVLTLLEQAPNTEAVLLRRALAEAQIPAVPQRAALISERAAVEHRAALVPERTAVEHRAALVPERTAVEHRAALVPERTAVEHRAALVPERTAVEQRAALAQWRAAVEQSRELGVRLHLRELARGQLELLHAPAVALATARENWAIQREVADARVLAAAARAANSPSALQLVSDWQRATHVEDVTLRSLLGSTRSASP